MLNDEAELGPNRSYGGGSVSVTGVGSVDSITSLSSDGKYFWMTGMDRNLAVKEFHAATSPSLEVIWGLSSAQE